MRMKKPRPKRTGFAESASQPAKRRAVNLSIRADVMEAAKACGLNASQVAEQAILAAVRAHASGVWRAENEEAIRAYNERVDRDGLLTDGLRRF